MRRESHVRFRESVGVRLPGATRSYSATIGGVDPGNPLLQGGGTTATAMAVWNPPAQPTLSGYRVQFGAQTVGFASEADWLRMEQIFREQFQKSAAQAAASFSVAGSGDGSTFLRTGAHVAEAVAGVLNSRTIRRKLDDLEGALEDSRDARTELDTIERSNTTLAPLIPVLRKLFLAERDATEASISVLEDQLTAVDIQTGSGVAKVAADLLKDLPGTPATGDSGVGTAVAVGGAGLGLGLLLSNNRDGERARRRRR